MKTIIKDGSMIIIAISLYAVAIGALAAWGTYEIMNLRTLTRIETLEKTCRTMN